jgi:hydrogenase maturation protein HypF
MKNPTVKSFSLLELKRYFISWQKGLNAPLSSSAGRLFDAVASLTDVCQVMSFEGESGMMLEELYDADIEGHYTFGYADGKIDTLPIIKEILSEENRSVAVSKFFHTLVEMIVTIHRQYDLPLVLSGGVFQNSILLGLVLDKIPDAVISNTVPPNDGGIALGQIFAN